MGRLRLDDRLPDPAGQLAARPPGAPVQAGEGPSTHSDPDGGSTNQCQGQEDLTFRVSGPWTLSGRQQNLVEGVGLQAALSFRLRLPSLWVSLGKPCPLPGPKSPHR